MTVGLRSVTIDFRHVEIRFARGRNRSACVEEVVAIVVSLIPWRGMWMRRRVVDDEGRRK